MLYRIISVGKLREPYYLAATKEYIKRLSAYTRLELIDGLEQKISPRAGQKDVDKALEKEALRVFDLVNRDEYMVILDAGGNNPSSEELAQYIDNWNRAPYKRINFIIGSAFGLASSMRTRAHFSLSLSRLTLPHQMAVMVLSEQIYRSFKILKSEPYHH